VLSWHSAALAGVKAQRINRTVKSVGDAVKDVAKVLTTLQRYSGPDKTQLRDAKLADNQTFKLYEERLVADKGRSRPLKH